MKKKKIALFGGSFDPIHLGHTTVVSYASQHICAEQIIFIPAKNSPLKNSPPVATDQQRLEMISMAIAENKKFKLSDCELKKTGPSYTLETVKKFQADFGGQCSIYWLVGADTVQELPVWYGIVELIDQCNISVMYRAGCNPPDFTEFEGIWGVERIKKLQENIIQTPLIEISSSEIKQRLVKGLDVANMLHPDVADYIHKHNLYQPWKEKA